MRRVLEPEVMSDRLQALAYARADFGGVNQGFVDDLLRRFPEAARGRLVDVGCGPADIPLRLSARAPEIEVVAVDASLEMLAPARAAVTAQGAARVRLVCGRLPDLPLPGHVFDGVISNSLLHHLPEPAVFWSEARRLARPSGLVHVMDLFRPDSPAQARAIVERAAADEDPILKEDFFNSLLAAFTPDEIDAQLGAGGLGHLRCDVVSERHWLVSGRL